MRIGTSNSTKILDSACVNEYKIPLIVMMENAVLSAFKHMDIENNQRYVIVSGVGNNGGDGLGLARQLTAHGKEVEVFIVGKIEKMSECSKINYNILKAMNIPTNIVDEENLEYLKCSVKKSDIVVDCIFGTGLEREIKGIFYNVIDIINQNKNKTYSIDVPSGINATNGDVLGICIDADKTISFEFYKRGFLKYDVKQYIGEVIVEHIGIPEYILEKYDDREYITNLDLVKNNIKEKNKFSFKSDFGKVALFAGSRGFTGAAYISTQSAVKCGSGLTTLVCEKYVQDILSTKLCEAMTLDIQNKEKVKKLIPQKYWVVAFHPETLTNVKMEDQVKEVLTALQKNLDGMSVIFMGTNADTKSDIIRSSWLNYVDEHENAYYYENLNVDSFLYLVKNSIALIGNSSSGIIETPSLGRYTINIGDRQRGRVHGNSVIDVTCDSSIIGQAMKEITGKSEEIINPYYVENTAENYYKKTKEILENGTSILKEFYDIV